ncbi:hypothetical protein MtrunA17_Chr7g0253121 [Medicago truncatula]|uniref:Transmembrane protein n=1 Tax=Medicago truncatula TaxID=3880 RepID=A2Q5P8_MEDTR|nr:hypothetical protein MtrDRAFT_AC167711g38v2 [Medicago truncatula]RHN47449.1 hypothetical protein MtrunA17_Chr7g0253121 [Medicago truncatula]
MSQDFLSFNPLPKLIILKIRPNFFSYVIVCYCCRYAIPFVCPHALIFFCNYFGMIFSKFPTPTLRRKKNSLLVAIEGLAFLDQ